MQSLTPNEIIYLDKLSGCQTDDMVRIKKYGNSLEKLISEKYLMIGTKAQSLVHSDMSVIRKLLKDKGFKAGGKKADLVRRILQNYTDAEIESADIPERFVLTDRGQQVIKKNGALLYYNNAFGATNILEPEQIIRAQDLYPADKELDILIKLFKNRAAEETNTGKKRVITAYLGRLYLLNHNDALACEAKLEVERLDNLWEDEREQVARSWDSVLGMSFEERQRLQQQALAEMDDEWEKELDAVNRAKAGIE